MQILLSCAKTMALTSKIQYPYLTMPRYMEQASEIALYMSQRDVSELEKILKVKSNIALENKMRYEVFHSPDTPVLPAVLAYTGIVFKHIAPESFSKADFDYAQSHLWLTSFVYGLLRPLDQIKNYRLEGDARLEELGGINIFDYWKDKLTDLFIESIKESGGVLLYLASEEMKRLFHWSKVESAVRVVTPEFKVYKGDKLKTVVVYAKMCRGEMARYVLQNRITDIDSLKAFNWEGFTYREELSTDEQMMFVSDQV